MFENYEPGSPVISKQTNSVKFDNQVHSSIESNPLNTSEVHPGSPINSGEEPIEEESVPESENSMYFESQDNEFDHKRG